MIVCAARRSGADPGAEAATIRTPAGRGAVALAGERRAFGIASVDGTLFDAFLVPALPTGVDALPLVTQAAFVDTTGALFASGPSYAVVVDAAP